MRRFGRQCRGQGKVFVTLVRQTEKQLLERGSSLAALAWAAQQCLQQAPHLSERQRARVEGHLQKAREAHHTIRRQSQRLTQGKPLRHCKIVNAYDGTIAPILKGKSNCPAQFGRKPGIISEPTAGFIFATHLPSGNPIDASYVVPLVDKVQGTIARSKGWRIRGLSGWPLVIARNHWFQQRAARTVSAMARDRRGSLPVFAHSYSALEIFREARKHGLTDDPGTDRSW